MGGALAYLAALHPAPSPLDVSKLPLWMIFVYFVLAAPVQEELIFRGLLQTTIAHPVSGPEGFWAVHFPVVFVAALFGVIHLDSGIVVSASAVLLGLIAGELRRMSDSPGTRDPVSRSPQRRIGAVATSLPFFGRTAMVLCKS